jgi:hypothetical protein
MEGAGLCLEICSLEQKWENDESEIHWRAQLDFSVPCHQIVVAPADPWSLGSLSQGPQSDEQEAHSVASVFIRLRK